MQKHDVVIASGARTVIGDLDGSLRDQAPTDQAGWSMAEVVRLADATEALIERV